MTTKRKVIKSLKRFTDIKQDQFLLASQCTFGHSVMDGNISVFSINDLKESIENNTLKTSLLVDVCAGVNASEYFTFNKKQFIVCGLDDGTIQVYNMAKGSYNRPVFSIK